MTKQRRKYHSRIKWTKIDKDAELDALQYPTLQYLPFLEYTSVSYLEQDQEYLQAADNHKALIIKEMKAFLESDKVTDKERLYYTHVFVKGFSVRETSKLVNKAETTINHSLYGQRNKSGNWNGGLLNKIKKHFKDSELLQDFRLDKDDFIDKYIDDERDK